MGAVSASRANGITMALEEGTNFLIVVKFAALIQVDVLAWNLGSMLMKPTVEPVERSAFRNAGCAVKCRRGMIRKKDVAGLTIEAAIGGSASLVVLGALTGKGEVNGDALPRDGGLASGVGTRSRFLHLGGEANGARIKDGVSALEVGYTINMLVGSIEIVVTRVTKALVP
jgi:hypothetical protein